MKFILLIATLSVANMQPIATETYIELTTSSKPPEDNIFEIIKRECTDKLIRCGGKTNTRCKLRHINCCQRRYKGCRNEHSTILVQRHCRNAHVFCMREINSKFYLE